MKKYKVTFTEDDMGVVSVKGVSKGGEDFSNIELLGMLSFLIEEVRRSLTVGYDE